MNSIAKIVLDLPVEGPFDYAVPTEFRDRIAIGMRALVPFGRKQLVGFIVGLQDKADVENVKPIENLLDKAPVINDQAMELTREMSRYYGCSWGEAIAVYLPPYLRRNTITETSSLTDLIKPSKSSVTDLYIFQDEKKIGPILLDNLKKNHQNNNSAILLVAESGRPKDVVKKLQENSLPAILYSGLTPKKEFEAWRSMQDHGPCVAVGTRSAVFAPVSDLGLIVIFDEDNQAYEQEQPPHYNSFDVARMRAIKEGADLLLFTPAPRAETWHLANEEKWGIHIDPDEAKKIQLIDMTNYKGKGGLISYPLQNELANVQNTNGSALILINRRGFAGRTSCNKCGHVMKCPRCAVNLTYIYKSKKLACGRCKYSADIPKFCPECKTEYLRSTGLGIEKLESDLARMYPQVKIAVYDRDDEALPKGANIIVATQAVLKWRNSFKPQLVALLDLDNELNRFDFRSAQKTFALIRRLKGMATDKMIVQTNMPDNPAVKSVVSNDPNVFYPSELKLRKEMFLPPYSKIVEIVMRGESEESVLEQARLINEKMAEIKDASITVSDIHPDVIPKLRDNYRYALIIKGDNLEKLLTAAKSAIKLSKRKRGVLVTFKQS